MSLSLSCFVRDSGGERFVYFLLQEYAHAD
jgi:hypothetical protein